MTTDNGKHRVCFPSVVVTKQNHATYVAAVTPDGLGMSNIPAQYWAFKILCITRQIGWLSIMGTAKVSLAYLQGQSSPTDQTHGPDKSPVYGRCSSKHATVVAPNDSSAAAGCLGAWWAATLQSWFWKHSKRHHHYCLCALCWVV